MIDGERDPIRIQMVLAIEGRTIEKVHVKSGKGDHRPKSTSSESHSMPRHASSSADATTVTSAVVASTPVPSSSPDLEATSGRGEPYLSPVLPFRSRLPIKNATTQRCLMVCSGCTAHWGTSLLNTQSLCPVDIVHRLNRAHHGR